MSRRIMATTAATLFLVGAIAVGESASHDRGAPEDTALAQTAITVRVAPKLPPPPVLIPARPRQPAFRALDIPLPTELQQHTWEICQKYATMLSVEELFDLALRVMWHESRYIPDVPDNRNGNGTLDRGLMQINSCVWENLQEDFGLDVSDPKQNIEAGVMFLSTYLEEYPVEHALTAYAHGESGASRMGGSCTFSDTILELEQEVYMVTPEGNRQA